MNGHINGIKTEVINDPLWYHKQGLMQTASGYGKKLVTEYKIKYNNRFYRVYCRIFSNIGTLYIISKKHHINVELYHE